MSFIIKVWKDEDNAIKALLQSLYDQISKFQIHLDTAIVFATFAETGVVETRQSFGFGGDSAHIHDVEAGNLILTFTGTPYQLEVDDEAADNRPDAQWDIPILQFPDGRRFAILIIFNIPGEVRHIESWEEIKDILTSWCGNISNVLVTTIVSSITGRFNIREIPINREK